MPCGNIVKFNNDLYIVADSDYDWTDKRYDGMTLIPFKHRNSSTRLSRKHPFTMDIMDNELICYDCRHSFNDHEDCITCFNNKEVPNPDLSIDKVEFIADTMSEFLSKKITKIFMED